MFDLRWVSNIIKIGANFSVRTQFSRVYNFGSRSSIPSAIFVISMFDLFWASNFIKIGHIAIFFTKTVQVFNSGWRHAISKIIFMINKLDLLWVPNFIALGIYFLFGTKFSWNKGIDTCFNVECMLLGHNFYFLGCYCWLLGGYWWLLFVTGDYCSLPLVTALSHFKWKLAVTSGNEQ